MKIQHTLLLCALLSSACKFQVQNKSLTQNTVPSFTRDYTKHPSFVDIQNFSGKLFVVGDVHGSLNEVSALLQAAGLAGGTTEAPTWEGGNAILVSVGDLIDKNDASVTTLLYLMNLQAAAFKKGGRVIVLPGNHEVAFLQNPHNNKAAALRNHASALGMQVLRDVHSPFSLIGRWLWSLPMATRVGQVFISHTGYMRDDLATSRQKYEDFINSGAANSKFACGDLAGEKVFWGFFNASTWWGENASEFFAVSERAQAKQIVFGHDPSAFNEKGSIRGYLNSEQNHALIKVDVGLAAGESKGELLICESWNQNGACAQFSVFKMTSEKAGTKSPLLIPSEPPPNEKPDAMEDEC